MKANTKVFCATLSRVLPVIRTRTTLPILTCVKLQAKDGRLTIVASDCDAHASASCECEGELAPVCVDSSALTHLARQEQESIELSIDQSRLLFKGLGKAHLAITNAEEFPQWPNAPVKALGINAADLADCITGVSWATDLNPKFSTNADLFKECVWVKTDAKEIQACGTNSKEFAYVKRPAICCTTHFLFPSKQADLLVQALNTGAQEISISERNIVASSEEFSVAISLVAVPYAPIEHLLSQPVQPMGVLPLEEILDSLRTIRAIGHDEPFSEVLFECKPGEVAITFKTQRANFERSIPWQYDGEPLPFKVDVAKAIKVMSHVPPGSRAALAKSFIMFTNDTFTYALALISM